MDARAIIRAKYGIHCKFGSSYDNKCINGIFIYADREAVFQGLVQSLEDTFPGLAITLSNGFPNIHSENFDVGLVLLNVDIIDDISECIERCRVHFPNASVALMVSRDRTKHHGLNRLFENKGIQGILPFTLKRNVWLAAIWLLLNGGEYYPYGVTQSPEEIAKENVFDGHRRAISGDSVGYTTENKPINTLTIRERQILVLVSEGLQNKIIADRLHLSEHTVKVHVHNLMRKLKVYNRTQAAAVHRADLAGG